MIAGLKVKFKTKFRGLGSAVRGFGREVLQPWLKDSSDFLAIRAMDNAPVGPTEAPEDRVYKRGRKKGVPKKSVKQSGGDLRASIRPIPMSVSQAKASGGIKADTPYALRQHEELRAPVVKGSSPSKNLLNLGFTSRQQARTREGGVGGKYLERPVKFHAESLEKNLKRRSDDWLRTRRARGGR